MRYAMIIWLVAAFALWDTHQNRGEFTRPVSHVIYRLMGGY
jgi:hypothetical protein